MESKLKLAVHESQVVPYEKEVRNNADKLGEDTKKGVAEIPNEKSKETTPRSESKVEDLQEAMQYPFFPFDGESEWVSFRVIPCFTGDIMFHWWYLLDVPVIYASEWRKSNIFRAKNLAYYCIE